MILRKLQRGEHKLDATSECNSVQERDIKIFAISYSDCFSHDMTQQIRYRIKSDIELDYLSKDITREF